MVHDFSRLNRAAQVSSDSTPARTRIVLRAVRAARFGSADGAKAATEERSSASRRLDRARALPFQLSEGLLQHELSQRTLRAPRASAPRARAFSESG